MCAAVPVALLLLVILAALTFLRLSRPAPNAQLLTRLLDSLAHDSKRTGQHPSVSFESTSTPIRTGKAGTA
ncbi:hypothetical protein [uncultured Pseudodesulfovibrio sp.]|uniref:hypothetical protein n=1 Tax=uncultured Pseudodesulfovibrio sp. TaxID=2035858 RepID=UPI0029C97A3C|nr:hypothetical protein [uncultured Pseudodesulfovibrio sp.]